MPSNKLTIAAVKNAKPGMHGDGSGLWLQVGDGDQKSWIFRYRFGKRQRYLGLGSAHTVKLADAREAAHEARRLLQSGVDPIEARKAERARLELEAVKELTFEECGAAYIAAHEAGWRNEKHRWQWGQSLKSYAYPTIGKTAVGAVNTNLILKVLEPIWQSKTETASRLRGRIETILDWAAVRGYRTGENPARWKGHLDHLLVRPDKVAKVEHHAALGFDQIGTFMAELRLQGGSAALALEFLILTAARTGEVIGARWAEIDETAKLWVVPGDRMKSGREHRVPLSEDVIAILAKARPLRGRGDFLFPGSGVAKPLSNMALLMLMRRMGRSNLTAHGFRSTFRDWVSERTSFPAEVAEMALAHAVGDKVEAAYRRGDLFEKRRGLMDAWMKHCAVTPKIGSEQAA